MSETKPASVDNSFSTFMFGLTLGVIGTLLLGPEDGRKISRQLLNAISEGIEKNSDLLEGAKDAATKAVTSVTKYQDALPYLPDQPTSGETPPPPPPYLPRSKASPSYFVGQDKATPSWP